MVRGVGRRSQLSFARHTHALTHAPATASGPDNPPAPPDHPAEASKPNSGRPSTACGMCMRSSERTAARVWRPRKNDVTTRASSGNPADLLDRARGHPDAISASPGGRFCIAANVPGSARHSPQHACVLLRRTKSPFEKVIRITVWLPRVIHDLEARVDGPRQLPACVRTNARRMSGVRSNAGWS